MNVEFAQPRKLNFRNTLVLSDVVSDSASRNYEWPNYSFVYSPFQHNHSFIIHVFAMRHVATINVRGERIRVCIVFEEAI